MNDHGTAATADATQGDAGSPAEVAAALRERLTHGDMVLGATRPILRHLLANRDPLLFSDEAIARVRGMTGHLARQLLLARAEADGTADPADLIATHEAAMAELLRESAPLISHAHSLVLEGQLTLDLQSRSAFDPVLSPLLQEQTASGDAQLAPLAMHALAAQARFLQAHRRMELPLSELPGDLLHQALMLMCRQAGDDAAAADAEESIRSRNDESDGRIGQLARLVMAMGRKAPRALALDHAGLAIFATALALASGQERSLAILSFGSNHRVRLALSLRAAGLEREELARPFLYLHPDADLPPGVDSLSAAQAIDILAGASAAVYD